MTLDEAVKKFESSFSEVIEGLAGPKAQNGGTYIVVTSCERKNEGFPIIGFDTQEEAIERWLISVSPYEGKKTLYWRIRPEAGQDENKTDFVTGQRNPNFGKWAIYSRFLATD